MDVVGPSEVLTCLEIDSDSNELSWNNPPFDYTNNGLVPGDYVYTFNVQIENMASTLQTFTFTKTLLDPCDPPLSLTSEDLEE